MVTSSSHQDCYLDLIELHHPVKSSRSQTAAEAGEDGDFAAPDLLGIPRHGVIFVQVVHLQGTDCTRLTCSIIAEAMT